MESLRVLLNKIQVAQFFNTDYNKEFTKEFAVGETVRVKLPQRFLVTDGLGYQPQPISRRYTTVNVDQIFGIHFEFDSVEQALKMERGEEWFKREYIDPAMDQLANEIDSRAALWAYQNTNNVVGTLGTDPTTIDFALAANQRLNELSCLPGERGMIVTPSIERAMVNSALTYFNPSKEISDQYKKGSMGVAGGFRWYSENNLWKHTAGTAVTSLLVTGSGQSGTSLIVTGTAAQTLKKGDVIGINNVNAVNPVSRRVTAQGSKTFVVQQDYTLTGGADTIAILPAIDGPGSQYQNVDALPVDGATITLFPGTTNPSGKSGFQNLALTENAFALVGVKMENPKAVEMASQTRDPETGISVAFVRMFDPIQRKMVNRFDCLLGFGNLYPDNCAVRAVGA
jgi:hypothetical protein